MINFLKENLQAVKICLDYKVSGVGYVSGDVLGFPAAVLLLATIDSIGTIKLGAEKSFEILRKSLFEKQEISTKATDDLRQSYRNPFLHNGILLEGRELRKGDGTQSAFIVENNKVVGIDLMSLLLICENAVKKFELEIKEEDITSNRDIHGHLKYRTILSAQSTVEVRSSILATIPKNKSLKL